MHKKSLFLSESNDRLFLLVVAIKLVNRPVIYEPSWPDLYAILLTFQDLHS